MHAGACSKPPRKRRSPVSAYERIARLTPPWRTASTASQRRIREQPVERGHDAVEQRADRLSAEKRRLRRDRRRGTRAAKAGLEVVVADVAEPAGLELAEVRPRLRLDAGRNDPGRLLGARQAARDDAVERDARQRLGRRAGLRRPPRRSAGRRSGRTGRPSSKYETAACRRGRSAAGVTRTSRGSAGSRCGASRRRAPSARQRASGATRRRGSAAQLASSSSASPSSAAGELALGDPERVHRDERPELQPVVVERAAGPRRLEELAHRLERARRGRPVRHGARSGRAARTPSRPRSGRARRSSTLRSSPRRCRRDCVRQPTAHFTLPEHLPHVELLERRRRGPVSSL